MAKKKVHPAPTSGVRFWLWQVVAGSGLTKKAFAERVGINETAFNNMYNGHRGIGDQSIYRIVSAMKVDPPPGYAKPMVPEERAAPNGLEGEMRMLRSSIEELRLELQMHRKSKLVPR